MREYFHPTKRNNVKLTL